MRPVSNFQFPISSFRFPISLLLLVLVFIYPVCQASAGSPDINLKISRSRGDKIGIAVPDFLFEGGRDRENFSVRSAEILMKDLKESGYFKPVDNKEFVRELEMSDRRTGGMDFAEWRSIGAEGVVKGTIRMRAGKIVLEGRLYDAQSGLKILDVRYHGKRNEFRKMVHRFSDEIVYKFIGEKGIATSRIAFISKPGKHKEVYICDYDGNNLMRLTNSGSISLFPTWSPDGEFITYTTFKDYNPDMYVINLTTRREHALSTEAGFNGPGSWSPDGRKLVLALSRDGNAEIYIKNRSGGRKRRLTNRKSIETSPAWSPTGNLIAFTSDRSGSPQIYLMDTDGADVRRITYSGGYNDQSSWSPDGSGIAYASLKNGHFDIYMISLADNNVRRLTVDAGNNQNPTWSPDGRKIAFSSNRNGSYQLYVMDADGNNQRRLLYLEGGGLSPAWSPRAEDFSN